MVNSTASTRTPPKDVPKTTCVDIFDRLSVTGVSVVRGNINNVGVISSSGWVVGTAVVGSSVTNGVVALVTIGSGVVVIISRTSVRIKGTE